MKRIRVLTPEKKLAKAAYDKMRPKRLLTEAQKAARSACSRAWALAHPDRVKAAHAAHGAAAKHAYHATWYAANKTKKQAQNLAWAVANPGRLQAQAAARYAADPVKHLAANAAWKAANPGVVRKHSIQRRAAELRRTPGWAAELTDLATVEAADLCRLREEVSGFAWHVDHVIPLQGKRVSGLHVWNNLAVIPAVDNLKKGCSWRG